MYIRSDLLMMLMHIYIYTMYVRSDLLMILMHIYTYTMYIRSDLLMMLMHCSFRHADGRSHTFDGV